MYDLVACLWLLACWQINRAIDCLSELFKEIQSPLCFAQVSPTYYILTALAITDLLTMLSYLPYAVYFYCIATPEPEYQHRSVWLHYTGKQR